MGQSSMGHTSVGRSNEGLRARVKGQVFKDWLQVMIVCICNALNDKTLAAAVGRDVCSVGEVFRRCGGRPQCGKCLPDIAEIIEQKRAPASALNRAGE